MSQRNKQKSGDNTPMLLALGVLGIGGTVGAVAWFRSRSTKAIASPTTTPAQPPGSLPQLATQIREATLLVDGCSVNWRIGEASRTELLSHRDDFFKPAIADARAKGAATVDEISAHLASLLVPGCAWPPTILQGFNLDEAVAGQMTFSQTQAWTIAQSLGSVRLYLTIRQVVAMLATQGRRG